MSGNGLDVSRAGIITRHRPTRFKDVIGNNAVVSALARRIGEQGRPHAYLFLGPPGTGKTSLSRIIASKLDADILEIDSGSNNGVDATRALIELSQHVSIAGKGRRMVIMNEVQALTRNAWNALLMILEEPPAHLFFALTTTEPQKIPEAALQRCYAVKLNKVGNIEIEDFLWSICDIEGWQPTNDILALIVTAATGQPRKALAYLEQVHDAETREEAERIIALSQDSDSLVELCRYLVAGKSDWSAILKLLAAIEDDNFAEAQLHASRYIMKAFVSSETEKQASRIWLLLDALLRPCQTYDPKASFYRAIGMILWG